MGKDLEQPGMESGEHGEGGLTENLSTGSKQVGNTKTEQTETEPAATGQTETEPAATGQTETEPVATGPADTGLPGSEGAEAGQFEHSATATESPAQAHAAGTGTGEPGLEGANTETGSDNVDDSTSGQEGEAEREEGPSQVQKDLPTADSTITITEAIAEPIRTSKSWIKHNKVALIVACVLALIAATAGIALGVYTWDYGIIAPGITISGVPVGNLTKEQATAKLDNKIKQTLDQTVKFSADGKTIEVKAGELGLSLKATDALEQAYAVGRQGSIPQKAADKSRAAQGLALALKTNWDDKKLTETLNNSVGKFNQPAKDASFTINDQNQMDIKDSQVGKIIDVPALIAKLKSQDIFAPKEIKVELKEDQPKLTKATLESQKITGLVSKFSTQFNASQTNRAENLRVAAASLDKFVIKPGETFSFNQVVGPRSDEAGYKNAPVIVGGELVPGLGGGVCQVSTTLYNALLLADVAIVERNNHSLAVHYVPLGRDATVAYPSLDLKFKNNTGAYLMIRSRVQGSTITFELYGQPKPNREVIITSSTEQALSPSVQRVLDRNLAPGAEVVKQAGQPGYVVTTTLVVKVNGVVVKTQNLGKSRYQPSPRIIATGP